VTETRATYRDAFAVRSFTVLFVSRSLAIAADTLRIVALSMLVFTATGSALLSAVTFGIGFLPQVIGGLMLGSLADRLRPRPLIVAGYLIECAAAVALALLPLPTWLALVLVAAVAAGTPVFNGASSRLVADVLSGDAYVLGRSLTTMSAGAAQLIGLAAGGVAVAALGAKEALLVTAACHLASGLIVRSGLPSFPALPGNGGVVRQSWSTNASLLADGWIRRLLLIQWLPCAFVVGAEALLVAYSARRGFPPATVGLLLAGSPAGMLLGQLAVGRFVRPVIRTRLVAPLILLLGLPPVAFLADPPLVVCGALMVLSGAGFAYSLGLQRAFVDAVPEVSRGQAFGLLGTGLMTLQGLGPVLFGALAQVGPVRWAIAAAGATTVATALLVPRKAASGAPAPAAEATTLASGERITARIPRSDPRSSRP
jgi:MFS family permease